MINPGLSLVACNDGQSCHDEKLVTGVRGRFVWDGRLGYEIVVAETIFPLTLTTTISSMSLPLDTQSQKFEARHALSITLPNHHYVIRNPHPICSNRMSPTCEASIKHRSVLFVIIAIDRDYIILYTVTLTGLTSRLASCPLEFTLEQTSCDSG